MRVNEVVKIAKEWVELHASQIPGFCGAYFAGSINYMPQEANFPIYRDVDVHVVVADVEESGQRHRKISYRGLILETAFHNLDRFRSAKEMLSAPMEAHNFAIPNVISDPTGTLTELQRAVAQGYAKRRWVEKRCEKVKRSAESSLDEWNKAITVKEMRDCFLWTLSWIVNLIAIAHLRPPTTRRCLEQSKELLQYQDRLPLHESILQVLGSAHMSREQVEVALQKCLKAFDRAVEVTQTPTFGSFQLYTHVKPYIAEGAQEMIDKGHHREAIWWIVFNHLLSNDAIHNDAPDGEKAGFQAELDRLMGELGILTAGDYQHRLELAKNVADEVFLFADEVVQTNPDIKG